MPSARAPRSPLPPSSCPRRSRIAFAGSRTSPRTSEFKADILAALSEAYRPGRGWVEAFARWMTRLFASRGLIFIDASHPRLKDDGRRGFLSRDRRRIRVDPAGPRRVARDCARPDTKPRSPSTRGSSTFSTPSGSGGPSSGTAAPSRSRIRARSRSKDDLLALAKDKPFLFSPNVLLRPIYQDTLLPTVAYVGGPGEIAYFAQMKGVYEEFGLPMPVIYPRKSADRRRKEDRPHPEEIRSGRPRPLGRRGRHHPADVRSADSRIPGPGLGARRLSSGAGLRAARPRRSPPSSRP